MSPESKLVHFVAKLVRLTQEGKVEWEPTVPPPEASGTALKAVVNNSVLRLYGKSQEVDNAFAVAIGSLGKETKIRVWSTFLEVTDFNGHAIYVFPRVKGLDDLYKAATYKAANVEHLVDSVLADE